MGSHVVQREVLFFSFVFSQCRHLVLLQHFRESNFHFSSSPRRITREAQKIFGLVFPVFFSPLLRRLPLSGGEIFGYLLIVLQGREHGADGGRLREEPKFFSG